MDTNEGSVSRKPGSSTGDTYRHPEIYADVVWIHHEDRIHAYDESGAADRIDWEGNLGSARRVA